MNEDEQQAAIDRWLEETRRVLIDFNIDEFIAFCESASGRRPSTRHIAVVSMHKARLQRDDIPDDLKAMSERWLKKKGYLK